MDGEVNNSLPVINMKYGSDIRGLHTQHLVIFKSLSQSLSLNVKKKLNKSISLPTDPVLSSRLHSTVKHT